LFRRHKPEPAAPEPQADVTTRPGSKGRPTRTRKEALEARKAAAKAARNPKSAKGGKGAARQARVEKSQEIRARMKAGDERYLMKRDQGPVRRFVRDFVDARLSMAEFAMPMLVVSLVASMVGAPGVGTGVLNATVLVVILDSILLRWRLRGQVKKKFGKDHLRGITFYAMMRALQMRFLRIPKPQVRLGQPLTGHYPQP
jgi:hypothetical protein